MSEERHIATFENAVSHLERCRALYHRQRDGEFTNDVLVRVHDACSNLDIVRKNVRLHRGDAYLMMFAQKDYLCHQIDDKQKSSELFGNAINFIERYLEKVWHYERHCFTCNQKGTATEGGTVSRNVQV